MTDTFDRARQYFLQGTADFEAGRLEQAERAFETSLALVPGRPSTLVNLGATRLRLSKPAEALEALDLALTRECGDRDAWCHRYEALARLERYEEALDSCDKAIAIDVHFAPAWRGRAMLLARLRRYPDALVALDRLASLVPEQAGTLQHRGQLLQKLGRHDEALIAYDEALALDRTLAQAWTSRGGILMDRGRIDEAVECYRQALVQGGDPALNGYFLASLTGRDAPAGAPTRYVQSLFDDYAETFDAHLVNVLRYEAHRFLVGNLRGVAPERFDAALDLGCGTGLCAPLLTSAVQRLEGVDLSPLMLEKARALGLYEQLVQGDLVEHLRITARRYDLVLAADVFIYVGDLEPVFAGVRRVLRHGGVFCFSVEQADETQTVQLNTHQRYAHSERYVRQLAARHGYQVVRMLRHAIREDRREPISGLYFYLVESDVR